jgi:hypothetical protein
MAALNRRALLSEATAMAPSSSQRGFAGCPGVAPGYEQRGILVDMSAENVELVRRWFTGMEPATWGTIASLRLSTWSAASA